MLRCCQCVCCMWVLGQRYDLKPLGELPWLVWCCLFWLRVQVVLSGFSVRLLWFVQVKLYIQKQCRYGCMYFLATLVHVCYLLNNTHAHYPEILAKIDLKSHSMSVIGVYIANIYLNTYKFECDLRFCYECGRSRLQTWYVLIYYFKCINLHWYVFWYMLASSVIKLKDEETVLLTYIMTL